MDKNSENEINMRRNAHTEGSSSVPDLHGPEVEMEEFNTVTVTAAPETTNTPAPTTPNQNYLPDDDGEDEKETGTFTERFIKFLLKPTPFARAIKMIMWGFLIGISGVILNRIDSNFSFLGLQNVPAHLHCSAFILVGYGLLLATLHSLVLFAHRQASLYQSNLLNWFIEFEEYFAAGCWFTLLLGIFANISVPKPPDELDPSTLSFYDYFFKIILLANTEPKNHIRLFCIALVLIVFSAVKRHFMHKLAIQFNYSNYCDRVEESLFIEDILQSLNKARQAYKFRKRWKLFLNEGRHGVSAKKSTNTVQMSDFVNVSNNNNNNNNNLTSNNQINLKEFSQVQFQTSPRSQISESSIVSPNAESSLKLSSATSPYSSAPPLQSPLYHSHSQPQTTSTKDKKRQFEEFTRLCNRTATQFDSLSGADIRVEIHRESRRLASQFFKWLSNPQRGDISTSDLEPFIQKPEDLARFLAILKRSQKVPAHLQTATFSEGDLRRAIDAALMERHGLAKSMETIEMALGKIDGILNFLLIVLVASLVERLFVTGGTGPTASPLLSITTIFFSASFFFKDVAKSTFESIIFLLIIHPFDIGDRVYIKLDTTDNKAGGDCTDNLLVVEMNLMSTVFERWDGVRIYISNSVLATKPIYNIRRSGPTTDLLHLAFAHSTRIDQLESLRLRLQSFLRQNRQDYTEFHRINVDALENCNRMKVTILIQHASNWQDFELQMARRTKILSWLKNTIEDLGINYLPPVQRVELISNESLKHIV